jgi:hypothetical protein
MVELICILEASRSSDPTAELKDLGVINPVSDGAQTTIQSSNS